jgi:hypothetical protein
MKPIADRCFQISGRVLLSVVTGQYPEATTPATGHLRQFCCVIYISEHEGKKNEEKIIN